MTDAERRESEARRKLIATQSRAANRPRPNRVILPADRDTEILSRTGLYVEEDRAVNWAALTRDG